jgi:hypothetical protein
MTSAALPCNWLYKLPLVDGWTVEGWTSGRVDKWTGGQVARGALWARVAYQFIERCNLRSDSIDCRSTETALPARQRNHGHWFILCRRNSPSENRDRGRDRGDRGGFARCDGLLPFHAASV